MKIKEAINVKTRREFIKNLASTGALLCLGANKLFSVDATGKPIPGAKVFNYKYKTLSIKHVPELMAWMEQLEREHKLSDNKTYLGYIKPFKYAPKDLPTAKSIIIMSIPQKVSVVTVHLNGKKHDVMIPCGYVDDGITLEEIQNVVLTKIIKEKGRKIVRARLPLKTTAVRSGLGEYGKNNICFIEGYGSYHRLIAFYTDHQFNDDHWGKLKMLRDCKGCYICMKQCPTQCIREENFVIDVGKCITLYNELPDPMPAWINASAHNTLIGCLKCQLGCPGNEEVKNNIEKIAELSEEETQFILNGKEDKALQQAIETKLKRVDGSNSPEYLRRNLKLALHI